jgi:hypothetical protein
MIGRIRASRAACAIGVAIAAALSAAACGSGGGSSTPSTGVLEEAGSMAESTSPDFWLNSGGEFFFTPGFGRTVQGELPADNRWHQAYAASSPTDTDGGNHPQNLFRLINRHTFRNFSQQTTFVIQRINLSRSSNRNQSNGVLLFNHYRDSDNLYYAGVRVDGAAVVKKKENGTYHTLAIVPVYPGAWDRNRNPNLIPVGQPITIHTDTRTNRDGSVDITLLVDGNPTIQIHDGGVGGRPIGDAAFAGIRTDFMDVDFQSYSAQED